MVSTVYMSTLYKCSIIGRGLLGIGHRLGDGLSLGQLRHQHLSGQHQRRDGCRVLQRVDRHLVYSISMHHIARYVFIIMSIQYIFIYIGAYSYLGRVQHACLYEIFILISGGIVAEAIWLSSALVRHYLALQARVDGDLAQWCGQ